MRAKRGSGAMAAHRLTRRGAADSAAISEFTAEQFNAEQACRRLGTSSADPNLPTSRPHRPRLEAEAHDIHKIRARGRAVGVWMPPRMCRRRLPPQRGSWVRRFGAFPADDPRLPGTPTLGPKSSDAQTRSRRPRCPARTHPEAGSRRNGLLLWCWDLRAHRATELPRARPAALFETEHVSDTLRRTSPKPLRIRHRSRFTGRAVPSGSPSGRGRPTPVRSTKPRIFAASSRPPRRGPHCLRRAFGDDELRRQLCPRR